MHKVSDELVEEVKKQDELVEGLLQMLLNVMKNVHEKTPVRKRRISRSNRKCKGRSTAQRPAHMGNITLWKARKADGSVRVAQSSPPHTLVGKDWSEHRAGPRQKPTVQNGK
eukprot:4458062-Heterocapsa_arctica.AAC.1